MLWVLAAMLGAALFMDERATKKTSTPSRARMEALVRAEAERQGVDPALALAFAEVESNFNPSAAGDTAWAEKKPDLYRSLVLDNPKMANNPARYDPRAWHSYGLFQLLAPHHAKPSEHPSVLYDPQLNAQRGVAYIKGLLRKHGDDAAQVRLAYAGALKASAAEQERVLGRFARAYQAWRERDAGGLA